MELFLLPLTRFRALVAIVLLILLWIGSHWSHRADYAADRIILACPGEIDQYRSKRLSADDTDNKGLEIRIRDGGENRMGAWIGEPIGITVEITPTDHTEAAEMRVAIRECYSAEELDTNGVLWEPFRPTKTLTDTINIPNLFTYYASAQIRSRTGDVSDVACDDVLMEGIPRRPPTRTPGPTRTVTPIVPSSPTPKPTPSPIPSIEPTPPFLIFIPALVRE